MRSAHRALLRADLIAGRLPARPTPVRPLDVDRVPTGVAGWCHHGYFPLLARLEWAAEVGASSRLSGVIDEIDDDVGGDGLARVLHGDRVLDPVRGRCRDSLLGDDACLLGPSLGTLLGLDLVPKEVDLLSEEANFLLATLRLAPSEETRDSQSRKSDDRDHVGGVHRRSPG